MQGQTSGRWGIYGLLAILIITAGGMPARGAVLNTISLMLLDDRTGGDDYSQGLLNFMRPADQQSLLAYVGWTGTQWPYDLRCGWEYSLSAIPSGATIVSATFTPKSDGANGNPGASFVTFYGYSGNGTVELTDLRNLTNPLATHDMFASSFASNVTPFMQNLVSNHATHAGITAYGINGQKLFHSKESTQITNPAAVLQVTYSIPEPASTAVVFIATAGACLRRRRRV